MKKIVKVTVIIGFLVFLALMSLYKLMNATNFQIAGEIINHVNTEKKVIALTFDDGPNDNVDEILQVLAEKDVTGTFYLIGEQIESNPEPAKKIWVFSRILA